MIPAEIVKNSDPAMKMNFQTRFSSLGEGSIVQWKGSVLLCSEQFNALKGKT